MEMATLVIYQAADKAVAHIKSTAAAAATADKTNALSLMLLQRR
jgi:hypothetical protein